MIRDSFRMNVRVKEGLGSTNLNLAKGKSEIDQTSLENISFVLNQEYTILMVDRYMNSGIIMNLVKCGFNRYNFQTSEFLFMSNDLLTWQIVRNIDCNDFLLLEEE